MPSSLKGFRVDFPNHTICVHQGSISDVPGHWDVVVSSDDNYLSHGGGVSRSIWAKAGDDLRAQQESLVSRGLNLGDIVDSDAYDFRATRIYHAVTLNLGTFEAISVDGLRALYTSILDRAEQAGHSRILLPLLAAGAAGHTFRTSCDCLVEAVKWRVDDDRVPIELCIAILDGRPSVDELRSQLDTAAKHTFSCNQLLTILKSLDWPPTQIDIIKQHAEDVDALITKRPDRSSERLLTACHLFEQCLAILRVCLDTNTVKYASPLDNWPNLTLSAKFKEIMRRVDKLSRSFPLTVRHRVEEAIRVRNRIAHGGDVTAPDTERIVMAGARAVMEWSASLHQPLSVTSRNESPLMEEYESEDYLLPTCLSEDLKYSTNDSMEVEAMLCDNVPGPERILKEGNTTPKHEHRKKNQPRTPTVTKQRTPAEPIGTKPALTANKAVRELSLFIRSVFDRDMLADLHQRLEKERYKGDRDLQITEFCARHNQLAKFLADELGRIKLRAEAQKWMDCSIPDEDVQETANRLLRFMGFSVPTDVHGLSRVCQDLTRLTQRIEGADSTEITGAVAKGASLLEKICLDLLQYLCQRAYRTPAEIYCKRQDWLEPTRQLSKCSLGAKTELLEKLLKGIETEVDPHVAFIRDNMDRKELNKTAKSLAPLRNPVVHLERDGDAMTLSEIRMEAHAFFSAANEFLRIIGPKGQDLYPLIVTIREIRYDEYGRRIVLALDEQENDELIFTDEDLRPGHVYFMKPFTNPMRVDPFLLEISSHVF